MPDTPTRTDRPPASVMANEPGRGFDLGAFATGALELANIVVSQHTNPELRGAGAATAPAQATPAPTPATPPQGNGMLFGATGGKLFAVVGAAALLIYMLGRK